jgi:hypothetical protein
MTGLPLSRSRSTASCAGVRLQAIGDAHVVEQCLLGGRAVHAHVGVPAAIAAGDVQGFGDGGIAAVGPREGDRGHLAADGLRGRGVHAAVELLGRQRAVAVLLLPVAPLGGRLLYRVGIGCVGGADGATRECGCRHGRTWRRGARGPKRHACARACWAFDQRLAVLARIQQMLVEMREPPAAPSDPPPTDRRDEPLPIGPERLEGEPSGERAYYLLPGPLEPPAAP